MNSLALVISVGRPFKMDLCMVPPPYSQRSRRLNQEDISVLSSAWATQRLRRGLRKFKMVEMLLSVKSLSPISSTAEEKIPTFFEFVILK